MYNLDQSLKINLTINGPALLDKSPYLLEAKDKYNKEELLKDYTNGKYTDKGLSNSPKLNTNVFPYERKENTGVSDINSYLRNLRIGVER
ncbi:ABC transporter ATP-binding protein [Leptotrichia sp. OH3620_COT-345]|nr:ABC transporter ATP-binding protein [Leptotrichia sp. OH3620_COT-345]